MNNSKFNKKWSKTLSYIIENECKKIINALKKNGKKSPKLSLLKSKELEEHSGATVIQKVEQQIIEDVSLKESIPPKGTISVKPVIGGLTRLTISLVCIPFITLSSVEFAFSFKDYLEMKSQALTVQERLTEARKEHAWLKDIGIAKDVYVGILKKEETKSASSGYYTKISLINSKKSNEDSFMSNLEGFVPDGPIISNALNFVGLASNSSAIHVGVAMNKMTSDFSKYVVRHELAHSIQKDKKIAIKEVSLLTEPKSSSLMVDSDFIAKELEKPQEVKGLLSNDAMEVFQKIFESYEYGMDLKSKNWQINYLHGLFTEGFADAYSLLIKTKDPQYRSGHMRQEALLQMRGRTYGFFKESQSAINSSGNEHSVQNVGFMIAQMPEEVIKKMTQKQIEVLSASISLNTLLISLARDSSAIDFFDEKNKDLFFYSIKNGAVELERQKFNKFWEELKSLVLYVEDEKLLDVNYSEYVSKNEKNKAKDLLKKVDNTLEGKSLYEEIKEKQIQSEKRRIVKKTMPSFMTDNWVIRIENDGSKIELSGFGYPLDPLGSWRYSGYGSQMAIVSNNGKDEMKLNNEINKDLGKLSIWRANFEHLWLCDQLSETCILNIKDEKNQDETLDSLGISNHWFVQDNYVVVGGNSARTTESFNSSVNVYKQFNYILTSNGKIDKEHKVFVEHNFCENELFNVVEHENINRYIAAKTNIKNEMLPAIAHKALLKTVDQAPLNKLNEHFDFQTSSGNSDYRNGTYYEKAKKIDPSFLSKSLASYRKNTPSCNEPNTNPTEQVIQSGQIDDKLPVRGNNVPPSMNKDKAASQSSIEIGPLGIFRNRY